MLSVTVPGILTTQTNRYKPELDRVPATSILGRMFYSQQNSILGLVHGCIKDDRTHRNLLLEAIRNDTLKICDVGCGGCADHLLLVAALQRKIPELAINILGIDLDQSVIDLVNLGNFPTYQLMNQIEDKYIRDVMSQLFEQGDYSFIEKCTLNNPNISSCILNQIRTKPCTQSKCIVADAIDLPDKFNGQFDAVSVFNMCQYIPFKDLDKFRNTIKRILREGGLCFAPEGIYKKVNNGWEIVVDSKTSTEYRACYIDDNGQLKPFYMCADSKLALDPYLPARERFL